MEELEAAGGDPKALVVLILSVFSLKEQKEHFTTLIEQLKNQIEHFLNQERMALARRDDALEAKKTAENKLNTTLEHLGRMLGTVPEAERITKALEEAKKDLARTREETANLQAFVAPGRWVLSILSGFGHNLLRKHLKQLEEQLAHPAPNQPYNEKIGQLIIPLIITEIKKQGDLVPKVRYVLAAQVADNYKFQLGILTNRIFRNPSRELSREQALALAAAFKDLNRDNIDQFKAQLELAWRQCPRHRIPMQLNLRTLKWTCTYPGCGFVDW